MGSMDVSESLETAFSLMGTAAGLACHVDGKRQNYSLHTDGNRHNFLMHCQALLYDLVSMRRENAREVRDMRMERIQTTLLVATLVFGCAFGLLVEGTPPPGTHWVATLCWVLLLFGSLSSSLLSMRLMWLLMRRTMQYNTHKPNENWCRVKTCVRAPHRVENYKDFYACLCKPVEKLGHLNLNISIILTMLCGALLVVLNGWAEIGGLGNQITVTIAVPLSLAALVMILFKIQWMFPDGDFCPPPPPRPPEIGGSAADAISRFSRSPTGRWSWRRSRSRMGSGDAGRWAGSAPSRAPGRTGPDGDSDERELLEGIMALLIRPDAAAGRETTSAEVVSLLRKWARVLNVSHLLPNATLCVCAELPNGAAQPRGRLLRTGA